MFFIRHIRIPARFYLIIVYCALTNENQHFQTGGPVYGQSRSTSFNCFYNLLKYGTRAERLVIKSWRALITSLGPSVQLIYNLLRTKFLNTIILRFIWWSAHITMSVWPANIKLFFTLLFTGK